MRKKHWLGWVFVVGVVVLALVAGLGEHEPASVVDPTPTPTPDVLTEVNLARESLKIYLASVVDREVPWPPEGEDMQTQLLHFAFTLSNAVDNWHEFGRVCALRSGEQLCEEVTKCMEHYKRSGDLVLDAYLTGMVATVKEAQQWMMLGDICIVVESAMIESGDGKD